MSAERKEQLEFAWKVHGYTNEYIRFADSKAGVALAIAAGLVASLFGAKAHTYLHYSRLWFVCGGFEWEATLVAVFSLVAFGGLITAAVLLVWAIEPRLWKKTPADGEAEKTVNPPLVAGRDLIYWESVREHGTGDGYDQAVRQTDPDTQLRQVTEHVFVLGDIAKKKYARIKWSIWAGVVGTVATLAALYLIKS